MTTLERNRKIASVRRRRGYNWEDTLVKRFNGSESWRGFRLGSPSVALPDILAVNNEDSCIYTVEAKSGTGTTLCVPSEQIKRCLKWTNTFRVYKTRSVILAFKFLSKKRIGSGIYESRKLQEYFKIWNDAIDPVDCVCTYEGNTYKLDGHKTPLDLKNHTMPFHKRCG